MRKGFVLDDERLKNLGGGNYFKENMGLTSWAGEKIKRSDVETAKNYLSQKELDALNKIVTAY